MHKKAHETRRKKSNKSNLLGQPSSSHCLESLLQLDNQNKVTLAWVSGHRRHQGNKEADKLAREDFNTVLIWPKPYCGVTKSTIKTCLRQKVSKLVDKLPRTKTGKTVHSGTIVRTHSRPVNPKEKFNQGNNRTLYAESADLYNRIDGRGNMLVLPRKTQDRWTHNMRIRKPTAREPLSKLWSLIMRTKLDEALNVR